MVRQEVRIYRTRLSRRSLMPPLSDKTKGPEIAAALDHLVLGWPDVSIGKMFGSRAYRAKGVLFAMIGGEGVILTKLRPDQREMAGRENHARSFVGHGRELPGWVEFPVAAAADLDLIAPMVRHAYENALSEA
jgi:hypothetical protein